MVQMIISLVLAFTLSGCTTSTSQTHFIDANGHDCLRTLKKVEPLGIAVSESVECTKSASLGAPQSYKFPAQMKITQKKRWFGLF